MSGDYVERLRGLTGPGVTRIQLGPDRVRDLEAALDELERLRAERAAWREGAVTRLEQATGQKVTLMLSPKDQCAATLAAEVRWSFQCEKLGGHAELHRVQIGGGLVEWRGSEGGN